MVPRVDQPLEADHKGAGRVGGAMAVAGVCGVGGGGGQQSVMA